MRLGHQLQLEKIPYLRGILNLL